MDILAISKDKREILILELKRGKASDAVVGQVQRYMGYALENLAEEGQTVRGAIVALEDDLSIRRALLVATNVEFYRYKVDFKLERVWRVATRVKSRLEAAIVITSTSSRLVVSQRRLNVDHLRSAQLRR